MRIKQALQWILFVFIMLFSIPHPSFAHAYIVKSTPQEDEVLQKAPKDVSIQFDEEIQPGFRSLKVLDQTGKRVDRNNAHINKKSKAILEASLKSDLPDGTYTIQWNVISSDGHPVNGTIPFQIGKSGGSAGLSQATTNGYTPHADMIIIRWLFYISCSLLIGCLFFSLYVYKGTPFYFSNTSKRILRYSIQGMFISIVLSLPLQTTIDAGVNWASAINFSMLLETLKSTSFGMVWILQIALMIILYFITYYIIHSSAKQKWAYAGILAVLAILASKSFIGHATTSSNKWIGITMDFLHMSSAALWIGSLLAMVLLLRKKDNELIYWLTIQRFSYWGAAFVTVIVGTGIYESIQFIPTLNALISTAYGQIIIAKSVLLLLMIGLALFNFLRGRSKNKTLGPTIWLEFSFGVIVFILAAILTNLPTGLAAPGDVQQTKMTEDGYSITLHITPNKIGKNEFKVDISKRGAKVKNLDQITLTLTCLDMDMGDNTVQFTRKDLTSNKPVTGVLSMAGKWKVHVHGITKSLQSIDEDFTITAGSQ
ncbi:copper resistance protein CopC [Bacillus sp. FJAT-49736]|uniref:copper resistance protein CopC n=1 Tax=Bacillus sp. FJAT-49736 TaxID=2833582 RepID=UPI001BCA0BD2|nr:copper resistance protein CopC [Bacillus sp. FJAT-49736]MBS4174937.1 copper resistance protein CopC [Bacillus sp. FJAT-49736]